MGKNYGEQPLMCCVKADGKLEREIIVVCEYDESNTRDRKRVIGVHMNLQNINNMLNRIINEINIVGHLNMPYFNLKIYKEDNLTVLNDTTIPRIIIEVKNDAKMVITEEQLAEKDVSHLIRIIIDERINAESNPLINETYIVPEVKMEQVIIDVLLDIAAYHSWDIVDTELADLSYRRDISAKKSLYAQGKGLSCRFKPDTVSDRYFSFASACYRSDGSFDIKAYNRIWEDFMKTILIPNVNEKLSYQSKDALEVQLKYYSKKKNISMKQLQKDYDELPKGSYILIRTEREPKKNPRCRNQLITCFGMYSGWKTGKIKFVELEKYHEVVRWYPYISLWKIVKL